MSAPAWIAAIATSVLAAMAVITYLGTFQIFPLPPRLRPHLREPAADPVQSTGPPPPPTRPAPPRPPPSREEFEKLEKEVAELFRIVEQLVVSFYEVANEMQG